ncbi:hypothetical protein KQI65_17800 [bacterium]|nr:hypothetical protein [bacterium]
MKRVIIVATVLLCVISAQTKAQVWEDVGGPYGGTFIDIITHGTGIVAAPYYRAFLLFGNAEGTEWREVSMPSSAAEAFCLLSPGEGRLLAGSFSRVYRSDDDGTHWEETYIPELLGAVVEDLAGSGDTLFACGGELLLRSTNRGARWNELTDAPPAETILRDFHRVIVGGSDGIWCSYDAGNQWQRLGAVRDSVRGLTKAEGRIYAALRQPRVNGVTLLRFDEAGQTWEECGLHAMTVSALAASQGTLYAGSDDGRTLWPLQRSTDQGEHWEQVVAPPHGLPAPPFPRPVAALFSTSGRLLAALKGMGIWRSGDNTVEWEYVSHGFFPVGVADVAIGEDGTMYAYSMKENFLARRHVGEEVWDFMQYPHNERPGDMLFHGDTIVLAMSDGLLSADVRDVEWSRMTATGISRSWQALYRETSTGRLLAGVPGLPPYYSDNTRIGAQVSDWNGDSLRGPDRIFDFAAWDGAFATTLGMSTDGVFQSTDGGEHWLPFRTGAWYDATSHARANILVGEQGVLSLISPSGPEQLLHEGPSYAVAHSAGSAFVVATRDSGVVLFRSTEDSPGTRLLDGLPATGYAPPTVCRIAFTWDDHTLYFGNCGLPGLWRITLSSISTAERVPAPSGMKLDGVYPNPVRESAAAWLHADRPLHVRVYIVDNLGRVLGTVRERRVSAGDVQLRLPTAGLSPGSYFLVCHAAEGLVCTPFVVLY